MHETDLILTLTGSLTAALAFGYVTQRLGLSPIVGYLLAGVAVGPHTPGFVANTALAEQLAEIGVILLMFGVGLHFQLRELLAVRWVAIPGAIGQSLVTTVLGTALAVGFGWGWSAGLVFGLAISVASTVVLTRVLADHNELHTPIGHIAVGWLVVEDLFTVLLLVVLPILFGPHSGGAGRLPLALGVAALKIALLVAFTFLVGGRVIPWLLGGIVAVRSRELFTLAVLVMVLGIAIGAARFFGASMALGAFLAGMIVGRSDFSLRATSEALPMRHAFAVLFFVSVGMLFDPRFLVRSPGIVAATLGVILVGKPLVAMVLVLLLRYPVRVGLGVAVALAQIGEFSFILAALGKSLGIVTEQAASALVAASMVSISLNPVFFRFVGPLDAWVARHPRLWRRLNVRAGSAVYHEPDAVRAARTDRRHRAVIIGYGPVGRTLARLLRENGIEPTIIELNLDTVHRLRQEGLSGVYGNASHVETLQSAGVERAASLILSASGLQAGGEIIRLARELNPKIRVLARTDFLKERSALRQAGADLVYSGEGEVALAMTEAILRDLGAPPGQFDRERDRLHAGFRDDRATQ